jgi:predicted N-formylglutamate amidohydrolase
MAKPPSLSLLGLNDPAPVEIHNTAARSPFLLIGDHAGVDIPRSLGSLGLSAADLDRHIACDIGVRGLGEALSWRLEASFIHQLYSRLVIDCNRAPEAPEAIPDIADNTPIPGNIGLTATDRSARIAAIHAPYHAAIASEISARAERGQPTILVALHSFTPALAGDAPAKRPWHIGVLHEGGDPRFALAVLKQLRREPDLIVGDNQPYRMDATDHSIPRHAFAAGLGYVELEVRQDLLADPAGQRHWSELIATALLGATM